MLVSLDVQELQDAIVRFPIVWDEKFCHAPSPFPKDATPEQINALYLRPNIWSDEFKARLYGTAYEKWCDEFLPQYIQSWQLYASIEDANNDVRMPVTLDTWHKLGHPWKSAVIWTVIRADLRDFFVISTPVESSGNGVQEVTSTDTHRQKRTPGHSSTRLPRSDRNRGKSLHVVKDSGGTDDSSTPVSIGSNALVNG